jgi:hypothetical protein
MGSWEFRADGFALGPERVISLDDRRVVLTPVWTDEDGVCVTVDTGEEPLPPGLLERVAVGMIQLAALPAPDTRGLSAC